MTEICQTLLMVFALLPHVSLKFHATPLNAEWFYCLYLPFVQVHYKNKSAGMIERN